MNLGEVKAQFSGLLNRRDITASLVTTFVNQAIARCQRELRIPAMEKALVATIGTTYNGLTIPNDFLQLIGLVNSEGYELVRRDLSTVKVAAAESFGIPVAFAREGSKWFLAPTPEAEDTVRIDYFAEFEDVEDDEDTNILTNIAPDLITYCALSYACDYFVDPRADRFEGRYQSILSELVSQAHRDELSGGAVMGAGFVYPSEI
jgi:hypothetical protein